MDIVDNPIDVVTNKNIFSREIENEEEIVFPFCE